MSRETRWNLVFLVVIVALVLPGGIKLFMKKLDPDEPAMYLPTPLRAEVAYLDPHPQWRGVKRVVPDEVGSWVRSLARDRLEGVSGGGRWLRGAASKGGAFEVAALAVDDRGSVERLGVVGWSGKLVGAGRAASFSWDGSPCGIDRFEAVVVPPAVREALRDVGLTVPAEVVGWYELSVPVGAGEGQGAGSSAAGGRLTVRGGTGASGWSDAWRLRGAASEAGEASAGGSVPGRVAGGRGG